MSLVIHTIVQDGIVISADTRTTIQDKKGNVRYDDTAEKITPFPNKIVVSSFGNAMVTDKLSVKEFLLNLRRKCGNKITITDFPIMLLNEYVAKRKDEYVPSNTNFIISGYDEVGKLGCRTYAIDCNEKTISIIKQPFSYGATFGGESDAAYAMMKFQSYDDMSLKEAVALTEATVSASIIAYKYAPSQVVGGSVKTYIVDILNNESGWLIDGNIVPDKNAPDGRVKQCQGKNKKTKQKKRRKS